MIDHGLDIQQAVETPRLLVGPLRPRRGARHPAHRGPLPDATIDELARRGHMINRWGDVERAGRSRPRHHHRPRQRRAGRRGRSAQRRGRDRLLSHVRPRLRAADRAGRARRHLSGPGPRAPAVPPGGPDGGGHHRRRARGGERAPAVGPRGGRGRRAYPGAALRHDDRGRVPPPLRLLPPGDLRGGAPGAHAGGPARPHHRGGRRAVGALRQRRGVPGDGADRAGPRAPPAAAAGAVPRSRSPPRPTWAAWPP